MDTAVVVVDIGSPEKGRLGWYSFHTGNIVSGKDIDQLVFHLSELSAYAGIALGFESPLFIPARDDPNKLTSARLGEGNRAWSAGAGTGVLATGLVVISYILRKLKVLRPTISGTFLNQANLPQENEIAFFEAFVSGSSKSTDHIGDAVVAANELIRRIKIGKIESDVTVNNSLNLLAACLLHAGWPIETSLIKEPVIVVKV